MRLALNGKLSDPERPEETTRPRMAIDDFALSSLKFACQAASALALIAYCRLVTLFSVMTR